MPTYQRNIIVGATVLVALLVFTWMLLTFSSRTAELFAPPQIKVHFVSARADGLSPGSQVTYLGVTVGRVEQIARNADGKTVNIDGLVDRDPPLPANLQGSIVSTSALGGGNAISLSITGDQPQGVLAAGAPAIPTEYVGLELNLIPPSISQTAAQIGQVSDELSKTLKQLRESGSIEDLDKTIKTVAVQAKKVGDVFDSLQSVLGDANTQGDLHTIIQNLRTTTDKLNKLADSLQTASATATTTIKGAGQDIDAMSKQVGDRLTQISAVLASVQSIMEKVDKGQGTAGQLVNDPKLYQSLTDTARELDKTVADLQRLIEQWEEEGVDLHLK
jgi:phospholipid/cholesterol/gamma-HCH transport system substrate-binding protein